MTKRSNVHLIKSLKLRPCPFVLNRVAIFHNIRVIDYLS